MQPGEIVTRKNVRHRAIKDLLVGCLPLAAVTVSTQFFLGLPQTSDSIENLTLYLLLYSSGNLALYLLLCAVLIITLPNNLPTPGLGVPNRITLFRGILVISVTTLAMLSRVLPETTLWWIIGISTIALILDGVDGQVARRSNTATSYGARFDMEVDAFLMLVLSILIWRNGNIGAWILLIGIARYIFVGAGWLWPPLTRELPDSKRRKGVCVVQGVVLLVCLGPVIPVIVSTGAAATALFLLTVSFGADTWWLLQCNKKGPTR